MTDSADSRGIVLRFLAGTLEVRGLNDDDELPGCSFDARSGSLRAPAAAYADVVLALRARGLDFLDEARAYGELADTPPTLTLPRDYQRDALTSWRKNRGRGVVVLPTGAGKTLVALLAIADRRRAALVVAPTLDLVRQWHQALEQAFGAEVGLVGGGEHRVLPLTVCTYDSAWLHMQHLGARFGLIVFDECHHLVAESFALSARMSLAPFRLGLTATPERDDGRDTLLTGLIGPIVYRKEIDEFEGRFLADYDIHRIEVSLSADEAASYQQARETYRAFIREQRIAMSTPGGFQHFIKVAARTPEGRTALAAWRTQRALAFSTPQKINVVADLIHRHQGARVLIFTDDNATVYALARQLLVPVITHQTKVRERSALLKAFADGSLPVLATSRVLNEGIDVPDAQVAIIVSGTGSTREHVQRLGRILRPRPDKRASLYELVSKDTAESFTSQRRREHVAYRPEKDAATPAWATDEGGDPC